MLEINMQQLLNLIQEFAQHHNGATCVSQDIVDVWFAKWGNKIEDNEK